MTSLRRTVADLQTLPETDPVSMYFDFGFSKCTKTCLESCGFTCGGSSCTHTVGPIKVASQAAQPQEAFRVSEDDIKKSQSQGGSWD